MRKQNDHWSHLEDSIIREYISKYNSLSASGIVNKMKSERPDGIKPIRYEGTSLYQHVLLLRKDMVA